MRTGTHSGSSAGGKAGTGHNGTPRAAHRLEAIARGGTVDKSGIASREDSQRGGRGLRAAHRMARHALGPESILMYRCPSLSLHKWL